MALPWEDLFRGPLAVLYKQYQKFTQKHHALCSGPVPQGCVMCGESVCDEDCKGYNPQCTKHIEQEYQKLKNNQLEG